MELPSDYWSGLLPLAALHLLVRPLSGNGPLLSLGLPRWLEDALLFLQLRLSRDDVERHFVFSEAARRDGRAYTLVTHMLLHESHAHLAANLEGLLVSAGACHDAGGLALVLLVYVGGGAFAAADGAASFPPTDARRTSSSRR